MGRRLVFDTEENKRGINVRKAPAPSKITKSQLDQIMVDDTIGGLRYYNRGKIDKEAEAAEVKFNRNRQKETNYQEYREWYKSLSSKHRALIAEHLGW